MRGFRYPFRFGTSGAPEEVEDEVELVASAVTQFLSQVAGERPYQPGNGLTALSYVFENESELVKANLRREIVLGLSRYEPRITVNRVLVRYVKQDPGKRIELTVLWEYNNRLFSTARTVGQGG